jgi:hypothetical protein
MHIYLLLSVLHSVKQQHGGPANLFLTFGLMAETTEQLDIWT